MEAIVINKDKISTVKTSKKMVKRGRCEVCGKPIMVAAWVAKILDKQVIEPTACSRAHANILAGVETKDDLDESEAMP